MINHAIGASGVVSQECKAVVEQYGQTIMDLLLAEVILVFRSILNFCFPNQIMWLLNLLYPFQTEWERFQVHSISMYLSPLQRVPVNYIIGIISSFHTVYTGKPEEDLLPDWIVHIRWYPWC